MNSVMRYSCVQQGELSLSYTVFGHVGPYIVAIHGHGRNSEDFKFLKDRGIVISIDLFFHGCSLFPSNRIENSPLNVLEFHQLFMAVLVKEQVKKYHLVAFSQGGRFALCVLPNELSNILSIQLISPDGMDKYSFYNRMSRKNWARKLFIRWEENPNKVIRYAHFAHSLGLMRPKVFAFVKKFAAEKHTFKRASQTWRGFRMIQPDERALMDCLYYYKGRFRVIMGRYDQVIRTKQAIMFLNRINQPHALIELPCGHDFFHDKNLFMLNNILVFE
jgi:pimeloyl-ACP methyl ester carboxylesterase